MLRFNILVGLTLIIGLLSACDSKPNNAGADETVVLFYCDESFSPIIDEVRQVFQITTNQAQTLEPVYTNENDAVDSLMSLATWLAITSRRLTESERTNLQARTYMPREIPIAYDGLAIITNNANTDSCISVGDLKRILKGEVKEWKDLYPDSKRGTLDVVFDNEKSSTVRFCVDSLLDGKPINSPNIEAVEKSEEVINYVAAHEDAIGIIGSNWLNDKRDTTNVTFKKDIRVMAVSRFDKATPQNSWKPYQYYLYNGNYPIIRTIYALTNDPKYGVSQAFANYLEGPKGQMIIFQSGLLPVRGDMTTRQVIVNN